jgi:diadenosine tetraphosphate (Ap4A) HIT family hydrolase
MERLFAGWRMGLAPGMGSDGRPHVDPELASGQTLFGAIEQSGRPDNETYILARGPRTFAILNVFPYTSGHVMVLPTRAVRSLEELDDETYTELWRLVRDATVAVRGAFRPQGLNLGLNEGTAGGGSHPDHLHVHVVPRWDADTNFMTSVAEVRVLPMTLADSWAHLRAHWPTGPASVTG